MQDRSEVARHESVHACVGLVLGKKVEFVRLADLPVPGRRDLVEAGGVQFDRSRDLDRDDLVAFLAGGAFEGSGLAAEDGVDFGLWPPGWPLLDGLGDRRQIFLLAKLLHLTEAEYRAAIAKTERLLALPGLQAWIARVAAALNRKGFMTGDEVEALRPASVGEPLEAAA